MAQIVIGGRDYGAFIDTDYADAYIAADPLNAAAWAALSADDKGRFIVAPTRILLRQPWPNGAPSLDAPPQALKDATAEFAAALAGGYDLATEPGSVLQAKSRKAGSVEIQYFRDLDNPSYRPPPLPRAVWDMIRPLLGIPGDGLVPLSISSGTRCDDPFVERRFFGSGVQGDRNWN